MSSRPHFNHMPENEFVFSHLPVDNRPMDQLTIVAAMDAASAT